MFAKNNQPKPDWDSLGNTPDAQGPCGVKSIVAVYIKSRPEGGAEVFGDVNCYGGRILTVTSLTERPTKEKATGIVRQELLGSRSCSACVMMRPPEL